MPIKITKYTSEMRDLYAFDPRAMISTNTLTGEGFHMITLKEYLKNHLTHEETNNFIANTKRFRMFFNRNKNKSAYYSFISAFDFLESYHCSIFSTPHSNSKVEVSPSCN